MIGEVKAIRLELKYCEACGALWLRPHSTGTPYCKRCQKVMAGLSRKSRGVERAKTADRRRS